MSSNLNLLADRLEAARRGRFVGRANECALFQSALEAAKPPFHILHIYGPGGVGKTTLLREFARLCGAHKRRVVWLDAREIEPSPDAFEAALSRALGTSRAPLEHLKEQTPRQVLFIDTFERLAPLDNWLRETFLPQWPDANPIVLAGRNAPRASWKLDGGWSSLLRALPLRNLNAQESHRFLDARHVPAAQHNRVLDFTHGHPLALSLVADAFDQGSLAQRRDAPFQPKDAPEIVRLLVAHLVEEIPTSAHRAALEACALVRWATEPLLAHLLELDDKANAQANAQANDKADARTTESAALFEWLLALSFIESGAQGLAPHDMAREALVANLRWRNPQAYADYHRRARSFYAAQLAQTSAPDQQQVLADYIFLHHDNSVIRPFLEWQENGDLTPTTARENDLPILAAMVRRHEGEESSQLFAFWFARQRENVLVFRAHDGEIAGFLFALALHRALESERGHDAATRVAWRFLQSFAPLRREEGATMFRFWMARDEYQDVSPAQSLIFVNIVRHYLTTPGLAFTFLPAAAADFWAPVFGYAGATRFAQADFQIENRPFGVYGHDWRATPPLAWLDKMAENEIAATASSSDLANQTAMNPSSTRSALAPPLLNEEEFAQAIRDALKNLTRPAVLANNPLLNSRFVTARANAESDSAETASNGATSQRIRLLQAALRAACEELQASGRTEKWYQALRWRYLEPTATQEAAAEKMDVPFSTFRRYLKSGLERVTEELWRQESGGF